ncbi:DUF222 domain-containing protein [Arthrobacter sp. zg-ZUI100]|uniref:HNH endonuclease signature motif containing protein n=1 Tax=Arthrobacter jiangjiafuii TaxID=2817475 RepID=UPI001AED1D7F|nr:HNH endonuclease signature motif containing protein [Arthrobacter jiangjiafuii]MBP3036219.1 DUF222 domain-containing protein [Arthrobacter jiangjiafuii]
MDQDRNVPGTEAGYDDGGGADGGCGGAGATTSAPAAERSRAVFDAGLGAFTGSLVLQGVEVLDQDQAGAVLTRLDQLGRWVQAQQAKVLHRIEGIFRDEMFFASGKLEPGLAFSLAAEEAATILGIPTGTAAMRMNEAGTLCDTHSATLAKLESGALSYGHVQTVLDQSQSIPAGELPGFEAELLGVAVAGQTGSQFRVKARRLRESKYPETIQKRQRTAFEKRRVVLDPGCDGMSWLSALLPSEKAQAVFTQLTRAARGERSAGDPRMVDQLRADILEDLLLDRDDPDTSGGPSCCGGGETSCGGGGTPGHGIAGGKTGEDRARGGARARSKARTEILVLISAETLFGADEQPAELHGYGPISPETARRMAREAAKWTPVERDPETEEILRVGRRRKVPAGLQRWLRARDGTCRFPGCRSNAVISEIDHTRPWAQGGATDHDNLEHLCRRHHMFKTEGFWKACQPAAGIIEWTSPGGRIYRTEPHLQLVPSPVVPLAADAPLPVVPLPVNVPLPAEVDDLPDSDADPPPF